MTDEAVEKIAKAAYEQFVCETNNVAREHVFPWEDLPRFTTSAWKSVVVFISNYAVSLNSGTSDVEKYKARLDQLQADVESLDGAMCILVEKFDQFLRKVKMP